MSSSSLHVIIIGGGLGGLCLAQGLRQADISVALYERDTTPVVRKQGYRIHIDARGASALRACLPSHLFELFTATASPRGHQITILNKRLRPLKIIGSPEIATTDPVPFSAGVDRFTLREILLAGLADSISFNKEFSHYEQLANGSIQVFFTDGSTAHGNVLIAADGSNSRVRQQFLPDAATVDTGTRCIYGKVLLTNATRPLIPASLHNGFTAVVGSHLSMALGLVEFPRSPAEIASQLAPEVQLHTSGSYLMWSLNASQGQFTSSDDDLFKLDDKALLQLVQQQTKDWHPNLRALLAASESAETFPIAVRVSVPCEPWTSAPITLLGDAIHAMSPAGGSGANMALLDASLLSQTLTSVVHENKPLLSAIHEYEAHMLRDGFKAVRFSNQGGVLNNKPPAKQAFFQKALRIVQHK